MKLSDISIVELRKCCKDFVRSIDDDHDRHTAQVYSSAMISALSHLQDLDLKYYIKEHEVELEDMKNDN